MHDRPDAAQPGHSLRPQRALHCGSLPEVAVEVEVIPRAAVVVLCAAPHHPSFPRKKTIRPCTRAIHPSRALPCNWPSCHPPDLCTVSDAACKGLVLTRPQDSSAVAVTGSRGSGAAGFISKACKACAHPAAAVSAAALVLAQQIQARERVLHRLVRARVHALLFRQRPEQALRTAC